MVISVGSAKARPGDSTGFVEIVVVARRCKIAVAADHRDVSAMFGAGALEVCGISVGIFNRQNVPVEKNTTGIAQRASGSNPSKTI